MKNAMVKHLYITIDTEMDADCHWKKKKPVQFSSVLQGIPNILRPIWDLYQVNPIYFVSPEVAYNTDCCRVLRDEVKKGAIIGAHLHPEYINPDMKEPGTVESETFPCFGYDTDIERKKILNLSKLIEKNLGVRPIWYRAARFGTDYDTISILDRLGYRHDSSFTPGINWRSKGGPNFSAEKNGSYKFPMTEVTEHPVTINGKRWGMIGELLPDYWFFYRWLRPTHMTYIEEKRIIDEIDKQGVEELVMMFHSMEIMVNKTPYVRNTLMRNYYIWRLSKTIKYAIQKGFSPTICERSDV